jgi:hypothetical protein
MTPDVWREAVNHEGQRGVGFGAEGAVAAFAGDLAAITQEIRTGVVLQQVYRVDDGDQGVSSRATSERELPSSSRKSKVVATGSGSPTPVEGGFGCGRGSIPQRNRPRSLCSPGSYVLRTRPFLRRKLALGAWT